MVDLYGRLKDQGFEIVAFPCNQFLGQEPHAEPQIKQTVTEKYGVTFPMTSKVHVKGKEMHPVFQYLTEQVPGSISWNFKGKYLVARDGTVVKRLEDNWKSVEAAIQEQLKA
eukprot:NODE_7152_length_603_cov_46.741597_g7129_i0.p1 GENE.NODE_7152_length_603_cov_46.741597_g7129_i0~~NODE_7152_length_603_cov_46.741597_g7129_i0.p1  ORF type:complete len:112 (-),score=22.45 NODE_7152_length_603_cov_46.741597_g7129_i0:128-463(-)